MPIRSSRGRAGAYRVVWQWPLRSPLRLGASLAVLVVLAVAATYVGGSLRGPSRDDGGLLPAPPSSETTPAPTSGPDQAGLPTPSMLPPVAPLTPQELPPSSASPLAIVAARNWAAAWVNHPPGGTAEQWLAGLRPYTTEEYLGVLSAVDPANVPASRVTGDPRPVRASPRSVQVEIPTDTLRLSVLVVQTPGEGWRVARYDRA